MLYRFIKTHTKGDETDKLFYSRLKKQFGLKPSNLEIYKVALVHKSAAGTVLQDEKANNERLEFLGDAIIDAIVTDYLYANFPKKDEGFLTKMRSRIVSRHGLNNLALAIGLDTLVVEQTNNSIAQKHIFGDALEAFVGAIFLDKGFVYTKNWVNKKILKPLVDLDELQNTEFDHKSRIVEIAQKHKLDILFHCEESISGKKNEPLFEAKLYLDQQLMGNGFASSKKAAEQNAAMVALKRIDCFPLANHISKGQETSLQN